MDMFNKLKSAVSSALPGNPLAKDFEVFGQIACAGPGMMWKVYNGIKRTTKQDAAVFVFEKKSLEKFSRRDKDLIMETLKKGASQLTRLRHPKILSVIQPLEESRESLAFATEPVFCSLANMLGNHDNLPAHVTKELQEYKLYEVEIKYGLLQITEALRFLHNDAKLLHNNLCPESVIINKNGAWKLAGFDFCIPNQNPPEQAPLFPFKDWDPDIHPGAQPQLDYRAPEYTLTESCCLASDMFSMGVVIYAMFNEGKPLYECKHQYSSYKKNAEELRKWRGSLLGKIPKELQDIVKLLLNTEPAVRPDPDQLAKVNFFEDVGSMTLQYMDSLFQQDNLQKSKFFKGLPKIIVKFPKRVNLQRILPPLLKECVNPDMIPFVLPNILQIAEQATDKEYVKHILPGLIPMFMIKSPVQILLIFMQNINLVLKKTPAADIKTHILPMVYRAVESDIPQIQELCLDVIPTFADLIEYSSLKNAILPRIKKLCLTTSVVGVRVNCLLCIGKLMENMDRWGVLDDVLPLLPQIPSREPGVLMSMLGIYRVAFNHSSLGISKDILAGKVLPFLIPLCIDNNLNLPQFNGFVSLIKEMIEKLETEHRGKLEQLEQMKQEQKSLEITKITEQDDKTLITGIEEKPKTMMDSFLSGFGMASMSVSSGGNKSETQPTANGDKSSSTGPQPAKVSLSLEEKQRLAKQQEQQRFMKTQKPLEIKSSTPSAHTSMKPVSKPHQPKDLTSSLMNSNVMGINSPQSKPLSAMSTNSGVFPASTSSTSGFQGTSANYSSLSNNSIGSSSFGVSQGVPTNTFSQSSFSGSNSNTWGQTGFTGQGSAGMNQPSKPVDLSSFDGLLSGGSAKPKMTLGQMTPNQNTSCQPQQGMMGGQSMMGTQGMMGNQSMMGNPRFTGQPGMMGSQGMGAPSYGGNFGGQAMYSGQPGGTSMFAQNNMGGFQAQPMAGQNMMQPQNTGFQQNTNKQNAASELDDLFG